MNVQISGVRKNGLLSKKPGFSTVEFKMKR